MPPTRALPIMIGVMTAVLMVAAAYHAEPVFAPLALALFIIAVTWPMHSRLQAWLPSLAALLITMLITASACLAFGLFAAWSFGRVGRFLIADADRYQALYNDFAQWLESHGISLAGLWSEHFNVGWLLRTAQQITGRINTTLTFWLVALVYVALGLLEVDHLGRKLRSIDTGAARLLLSGSHATAAKLRTFLLVRTQMSVLTGLLVWSFTWLTGLPFAAEWGAIAFALNYIPFIGPLVATLFPTLMAITHFATWQAVVLIFVCLNFIQIIVGSYIEPRVAGRQLSMSPFVVVFAIFFWTFLWGLFGAFIGVPITLAVLTFCAQHPSSRWLPELFGGTTDAATNAQE